MTEDIKCMLIYIYTPCPKKHTSYIDTLFSSEDQYKLQNDIYKLKDWANQWLLKHNVDKCCGVAHTANRPTCNLCKLSNTKYYIENGNKHYKLVKVDSVSDL